MSESHLTQKSCGTCEQTLDLESFHKDKTHRDGLRSKCKDCCNTYQKSLRKTPRGLACSKWHGIVGRVGTEKAYEHVELRMTKSEFINWAVPLLAAWDWNLGIPSVDRIEVKGHYELSNLQIISWAENTRKDRRNSHAPPETKWCRLCGEFRPWDEFQKSKCRTFGLNRYCRFHHNQRARARYAERKRLA